MLFLHIFKLFPYNHVSEEQKACNVMIFETRSIHYIILYRKSSYNRLCLYRVLKHENEKKHVYYQPCPSKKNIKKSNTNIFMRTLFSPFQTSDRNRDNVYRHKESCQLAFAKRIRHVSKEMAKIITLKIF